MNSETHLQITTIISNLIFTELEEVIKFTSKSRASIIEDALVAYIGKIKHEQKDTYEAWRDWQELIGERFVWEYPIKDSEEMHALANAMREGNTSIDDIIKVANENSKYGVGKLKATLLRYNGTYWTATSGLKNKKTYRLK